MTMNISERRDQVRNEYLRRAETIGDGAALVELCAALVRAEERYDRLEQKVLALVEVQDRRGIFLPPARPKGEDERTR